MSPFVLGTQIFRDMLRADVEGRPFSPPPPSAVPPPMLGGGSGSNKSSHTNSAVNSRNASQAKNLDDWGDWDGDKVGCWEQGRRALEQ